MNIYLHVNREKNKSNHDIQIIDSIDQLNGILSFGIVLLKFKNGNFPFNWKCSIKKMLIEWQRKMDSHCVEKNRDCR